VDLLANGPSSQLRVIAGRLHRWHSAVAALSSHVDLLELNLELREALVCGLDVSLQEVGMDDAISCPPVYLHDLGALLGGAFPAHSRGVAYAPSRYTRYRLAVSTSSVIK
jgi:hypothetical protein